MKIIKNSRSKPSSRKSKLELPDHAPRTKSSQVIDGFADLWSHLFTSPIHLDSLLSKQSDRLKGILAQIVPAILLKPASLAEAVGVGVPEGEPWSLLKEEKINRWRPAQLMAERLYELMSQGWPQITPQLTDFPPRMTQEWENTWGMNTAKDLVNVLGREAPLSLRAVRNLGAKGLLEGLNEGTKLPTRAEISHFTPWGVRLAGYAPVLNTDLYKKGSFEIQDEGSQVMALFALWPKQYGTILQDRPGPVRKKVSISLLPEEVSGEKSSTWTVVDTCAGAGGKTLAMADALKGKGRVYAYDTSEKKLQALRRRATRLGLNNIQAVALEEGNEAGRLTQFSGKANIVLVDAPCSGWGVLRRNSDIKWRQKEDVLVRMPEIQLRLLSLYSVLVAPGGRLVYGVCTFRMEETREVVRRFLESHPQFKAQEGGFLGPGPCDGFFMQAFARVD